MARRRLSPQTRLMETRKEDKLSRGAAPAPLLVVQGRRLEQCGGTRPEPGGLLGDLVRRAALVDCAADAMFGVASRGAITSWNAAAERLYGYRAEEIVGCTLLRLWPSDARGAALELLQNSRSGPVGPQEVRQLGKNARPLAVLLSLAPVRGVGGRVQGTAVVARPLPPDSVRRNGGDRRSPAPSGLERRQRESSLLQHAAGYLQTCATPAEAFGVLEQLLPRLFPRTSGRLFEWNPERRQMEARTSWGAAAGQERFDPAACWAWRQGRLHRGGTRGPACGHWTATPADAFCAPLTAAGETLGLLSLHPRPAAGAPPRRFVPRPALVEAAAGQIAVALSSLRRQEALREECTRDPLTGLGNRRGLELALPRLLEHAAARQSSLSVVICDLDRFKSVNDACGHAAGDRLLRAFGRLLRANMRSSDLVCRCGGDEFVLVFPEAAPEAAAERAEALRLAWERWLNGGGVPAPARSATLSFGVAGHPAQGASVRALLRAADAALYRAKTLGRNRVAGVGGVV